MEFPLRSFWATPAGALRQPPAPGKVALLGFQWCCALLVFVCMSNQRAGLWGPSPAACAACNGTGGSTCTSGMGGPHGLGCPYTAFGQFQFLCAVGVMWWTATATLLLFAYIGRNPPLMTEFLIYVAASVFTLMAFASALAMCSSQPWFAFFMWDAQLLSCYWCFREWRYTQFEGLPPRVSASLNKIRASFPSAHMGLTVNTAPSTGISLGSTVGYQNQGIEAPLV